MCIRDRPQIEVKALCTVHGNTSVENTTRNTLKAAFAAGGADIPVYPGAAAPMVKNLSAVRAAPVPEPVPVSYTHLDVYKRQADSIVYTIDRMVEGSLPFGKVEPYGITEGGVGLADNEYYRSKTPAEVLEYMDGLQKDVVEGKVKVPSYFDFEDYDAFVEWRDQ